MAAMLGSWLRIVALITLVAAVVVTSGALTTASALLAAPTPDRCCEGGARQSPEEQVPCTTPDCACSHCLSTAVLAELPVVEMRQAPAFVHPVLSCSYHPKEYPTLIEYPPEAAV